jgi:uncharacterized membrane protein
MRSVSSPGTTSTVVSTSTIVYFAFFEKKFFNGQSGMVGGVLGVGGY